MVSEQRRTWLMVLGLAGLAFLLAAIATRNGAGITPDSTVYIAGARNLASGLGFVGWDHQPVTFYPPGFPITLRAVGLVGVDAVAAGRWINATAFAALVILSFVLARRHVTHVALALFAAACVAVSSTLLVVSSNIWSDPVFCVLVVAQLLVLDVIAAQKARDARWLLLAGVIGGLGFSYRYVGVTLLLLPFAVVVVVARGDGVWATIKRLLVFSISGCVIPAIVIARNLSDGSGAFGDRKSSVETIGHVIDTFFGGLTEWTFDHKVPGVARGLALIAVGITVVAGAVLAARSRARPRLVPVLPIAFIVVYSLYLAYTEMTTNVDPIAGRLLAPLVVPMAVILAWALDQIAVAERMRAGTWTRRLAVGALVAYLVAGLAVATGRAIGGGDDDNGFASVDWQSSPLAAKVAALPDHAVVYSDVAAALYAVTRHQPVVIGPAKTQYRSNEVLDELPAFRRSIANLDDAYLAWFTARVDPSRFYSPDDLVRHGFKVQLVASTEDGALYRVSKG